MSGIPAELGALDAWLAEREARQADLRPDNHARIVWAGGERLRRPLAMVYLHGFSASPMETNPLCDLLAGELGAHLYLPRLRGHGRSPAALAQADDADWLSDAREALEVGLRLGERVVLVGTSTGGTLATLLAAEAAESVAALILIAPNFGLADRRTALLTWPGARRWLHWLVGRERIVEADNDAHARYWTLRYATHTLVSMYALVRRLKRHVRPEQLTVPVLAVFCDEDQVVDARRTRAFMSRLPDGEIMTIAAQGPGSQHVVVGDAFGPQNTAAVLARCRDFLSRRALPSAA
ncbi:MAG: alpha/beta fold hydrolase [Gammaproteobacteria bacterium]|nr:alpha/beta fold hydrolase [Gammaproteobacteria bacterium]